MRETGFKPIFSSIQMTKQRRVVKTVKRKTQIVKRTRNSYPIEHKKEVIAYAKNHGNNQAARHFDIDCGIVSRWVSASSNEQARQRRKVSGLVLVEKPYFQKQRKSFIL